MTAEIQGPFARFRPPFAARSGVCMLALLAALHAPATSAARDAPPDELARLSLEALMNIEVVSVAKRAEPLQASAAAVYVLSGEQIRASGARSLPEALRLVPGLTVARVNARGWAVTARGFNSTIADKMEVLLDGRSLYTQLFSGVFWEAQDTLLEDIDRIEVIRGPGAALWGANAVNGVINIVTKGAAYTQGTFVEAGGGGEFRGYASARQGGRLGERGHYRLYGKTTSHDDHRRRDGSSAGDNGEMHQVGFRTDWLLTPNDRLTVQGDAYRGDAGSGVGVPDQEAQGYNLLSRWTRTLGSDSELSLQGYFDRAERDDRVNIAEDRDTWDIELRHTFLLGAAHTIVWGGGYRRSSDDIRTRNPLAITFEPGSRTLESFNLFVQDQWELLPDTLVLTLGAKLEKNDFTDYEVQPSLRFSFTPSEKWTLWGAVSRAVRIPNRVDHNITIGPVASPLVRGSERFGSESVIAYELGYRRLLADVVSVDVAAYYNDFDELRGIDTTQFPNVVRNVGEGRGSGVETVARWSATPRLMLEAAYNYQDLQIAARRGTGDTVIETSKRNDPRHQAMLRALWNPAPHWTLHAALRHVDELPSRAVDDYTELDLRVAWRPFPQLELSVTGNNLLDSTHAEFSSGNIPNTQAIEIRRSVHGAMTWRFPGW